MHKTVLLNEVIEGLLAPQKAGNENLVVVDGTFGGGGHSREICRRFPGIKIIAIDQDQDALDGGRDKFKDLNCEISFHNVNFRNMNEVLKKDGIEKVDGIILDLGLSSDQLENSGRGFSFMKDEPLLMNIKKSMKENPFPEELTAEEVVNDWSQDSLEKIIYGYGEEKFSGRIARGIVEERKKRKIKTTSDLVAVISKMVPAVYRRGRIHFATRTFQAIRIAVNDELGALSEGLAKGWNILSSGGRIAVISFHSLEDRIVKKFYKTKEQEGLGRLINKKPIVAGGAELKENPRARSAKLRVLEKI
ncbi:16S rRNA (cytosine(1402)-N(4))-methyltransferase [Candidatus Nomurabacteria bacterium RIFCSPHIGHO2_02_FULL_42_19]|uniref:Ribosomal RNA small subunit methyltransferase H n=1 Tax=Candidatus Nomurabacteria bacterium RIFCSPHIGHO2_02_FULL_42_19 TaxID=1801756 RepID=A0A1F6W3K6_9BACT|nr:MAG: 16S rRNA (cytosine(1402)-N(4))-methyltransferase [Candidatus Nomurabacteria bacterium RIFCSPHIGHO2_02_FULL_42_19]